MAIYYKKTLRKKSEILTKFLVFLADLLTSMVALYGAQKIRFVTLKGSLAYEHGTVVEIFIIGSLLYTAWMFICDGYRGHSLLRFQRSFVIIWKVTLLWIISFMAINYVLKIFPDVSRLFLLFAFVLNIAFCSLGRWILLSVLKRTEVAHSLRERVVFIDWTSKSRAMALSVLKDKWHPYEIVGIVPPPRNRFTCTPESDIDLPVMGSYPELHTLYSKSLIHISILADGDHTEEEAALIASNCERHLVTFMVIPKGFQILLSSLKVTSVSGVPVLGVSELPLERPANHFCKRLIDYIGALVGIVLFAPVIAVFCALVYMESPGPVFYRQRRVGYKGREFDILKIRSMRLDAEKETGARWAVKNDNRRLRVGAFMRRWNIDELPQFLNVLAGHMSLIGPRPERPELIVNFLETIKHYNARHHVMPGITGWAAVNGLRGDTSLQDRIYYDLYYMENWSLALDLQILVMTFFKWDGAG
jgi:exopolysaccharide biosynthesis polyprenyl glycosylphosphotransferase